MPVEEFLPPFFALLATVLFGLCLGSFATALAWRLPRGISMIRRVHSACTRCGHDLSARDLVPVFSYLFMRGRCRYCEAPIGFRYPAIEIATMALCLAFFARFGLTVESAGLMLLSPALVALVDIDFRYKIIPDSLNIWIFLCGLLTMAAASATAADAGRFLGEALTTGLGGALLYGLGAWALRQVFMVLMRREALGLGDVKFFAAAGVWLGLEVEMLAAFLMLSGFAGVGLALLWRRLTGDAVFPFGPALVLAFVVSLCWRGAGFMWL